MQHEHFDGHLKINAITFVMTRRCNAFCDFCCNDDGPSKKGIICPDIARVWIDDFVSYIPYCRSAAFTGGEPFLCFREMLSIHEHLARYEFKTNITTNGYWGKDPKVAAHKLNTLKDLGLRRVIISMDPSHARWIPAKHAAQAAKTAVDCGLKVTVASHFYTTDGTAKDYFEPEWHPLINWEERHYVLPVGRAENITVSTEIYRPTHLFCPGNELVIQPNGDVEPCCSVCLDDDVFVIGNLHKQSMLDVLTSLLGDAYLKIIAFRGMDELEAIVHRYHPDYVLPPRIHSVCSMCNALRRADNFWMVADAMQEYCSELILYNYSSTQEGHDERKRTTAV